MRLIWVMLLMTTECIAYSDHTLSVSPAQWQQQAIVDILFIRETIKANHPAGVKDKDPQVSSWLEYGTQQALMHAQQAQSRIDYQYTLRFYINGFKDSHVYLNFKEQETPLWPGFLIAWRNGDYYVHTCATGSAHLPPTGARLIACDTMTPNEYMQKSIFPYFGNPILEAHWYMHAPRLLLDGGCSFTPKPNTCTFEHNGTVQVIPLAWTPLPDASIIANAQGRSRTSEPCGITPFGTHGIWVRIPSFAPQSEEQATLLRNLITQLSTAAASTIIFDLRGNTGGDSSWGGEIIKAVYGSLPPLNDIAHYRVSQENCKHFESLPTRIPLSPEIHQYLADLVQRMKGALIRHEDFVTIHIPAANVPEQHQLTLNNKRTYVVTDTYCVSAALDFLDILLQFPNVIHVGLPTNADTIYMEIRTVTLPSGSGTISIPTKIDAGRIRGHNQAYIPAYRYNGDITDTNALQQWLLELDATLKI